MVCNVVQKKAFNSGHPFLLCLNAAASKPEGKWQAQDLPGEGQRAKTLKYMLTKTCLPKVGLIFVSWVNVTAAVDQKADLNSQSI